MSREDFTTRLSLPLGPQRQRLAEMTVAVIQVVADQVRVPFTLYLPPDSDAPDGPGFDVLLFKPLQPRGRRAATLDYAYAVAWTPQDGFCRVRASRRVTMTPERNEYFERSEVAVSDMRSQRDEYQEIKLREARVRFSNWLRKQEEYKWIKTWDMLSSALFRPDAAHNSLSGPEASHRAALEERLRATNSKRHIVDNEGRGQCGPLALLRAIHTDEPGHYQAHFGRLEVRPMPPHTRNHPTRMHPLYSRRTISRLFRFAARQRRGGADAARQSGGSA